MLSILIKLLVFIVASAKHTQGFYVMQGSAAKKTTKNIYERSPISIPMLNPQESIDLSLPDTNSMIDAFSSSFFSTGGDPNDTILSVESLREFPDFTYNILNDLAHIGLDFVNIISDRTETVRLIQVFGRVFAILSDYLPDNEMEPDAFLIQMYMLYVTLTLFVKSITPIITSLGTELSFQDLRLYSKLFKPAGVTRVQFKAIVSKSFEWIRVPPLSSCSLASEEQSFYLLYRGKIKIISNQEQVSHQESISDCTVIYDESAIKQFQFFGDLSFICTMIDACLLENIDDMSNSADDFAEHNQELYKNLSVTTEEDEALLLRINTTELIRLMSTDERLFDSMKYLLFNKLNDKYEELVEA